MQDGALFDNILITSDPAVAKEAAKAFEEREAAVVAAKEAEKAAQKAAEKEAEKAAKEADGDGEEEPEEPEKDEL